MRFSYAESMTDPSYYLPLARAAEDAGFDSFVVPDSICYPQESDSTYPYTPDGNREFLEDKPFIEPFSLIPAMGAVTERLRFTTFVVKLPILIGGHAEAALKRAARLCDGWMHAGSESEQLPMATVVTPWRSDSSSCGASSSSAS